MSVDKYFDTVIIGAGISGLSAARTLFEHGHNDFLVVDNGDKIGGRIRLMEFDNKQYATGAGWIHGRKNNPIYNLAVKLGISLEKCIDNENTYHAVDSVTGDDVTEEYIKKRIMLYEDLNLVFKKMKQDEINSETSLYDAISNSNISINRLNKTVLFSSYEIYCGAQLKNLSYLAEEAEIDRIYNDDKEIINFKITDPNGIPKIIDYLAEPVLDRIMLNSNVEKIIWKQKSTNNILIKLTNQNQPIKCRHLIITIQSHLLLNNLDLFEPQVPQTRINAWKSILSCDYCRLIVQFQEAFWPINKEWLINVTDEPSNSLCLWQNMYGQNMINSDPNILICHLTSGNCATEFKLLSKTELIDRVHEIMMAMFKNVDKNKTRPINVKLISHWSELSIDNYARWQGAFSYLSMGFIPGVTEKVLKQPMGSVLFAGESNSPEYIGTLQGAYITGQEAAMKCIEKKSSIFDCLPRLSLKINQ